MMENSFGKRLRSLRKAKKMTQVELTRLCNLGDSTLSFYESGKRKPNYTILLKLAKFLNTTPNYLLTGKDAQAAGDWWERDTEIELAQFIREQPNLRVFGEPLDEDVKDDVMLALRTGWEVLKKEKAAKKRKGKRASQDAII
ncbi:MAG: helix-turn-helix transcriptional regulator [Desulfotomaculaceae bacterium]|nr:helix-turn-helix transcriptional regulator [Desulfotomaculaceae bacterium]